jgi:hypothetical protein
VLPLIEALDSCAGHATDVGLASVSSSTTLILLIGTAYAQAVYSSRYGFGDLHAAPRFIAMARMKNSTRDSR